MLENKVCVITGAAGGIGLATTEVFIMDGAKVVMADITGETLEREANRLGQDFLRTDLTKQKECKGLIEYALRKHSKVDILVNIAGIQTVSPIDEFPEDKWETMLSLMLTAPFLLTKYVWPTMKAQGWGRIINLNSIHGLVASEFKAAYVSAKHGLGGLTKVAALEGARYGITVNSICPSYVKTPLVEKQISDQAKAHDIPDEQVISEIMLQKAAIKKILEPKDVGDLAKFLCSDTAACITGTMLPIDCGWTAA